MTELERYKKALETAQWWIDAIGEIGERKNAHREIDMALNPPPKMETVHRVIWQLVDEKNESRGFYPDFEPSLGEEEVAKGWRTLRFECEDKRTLPMPVEKSAHGKVCGRSGMVPTIHVVLPHMEDVPEIGAEVTVNWTV